MRTINKSCLFMFAIIAVATFGCKHEPTGPIVEPFPQQYDRPLPAGEHALRKVEDPNALPNIAMACINTTGLREATANSLNFLSKPSSRRFYPCSGITHEQVVASLNAFAKLLDAKLTPEELRDAVLKNFDIYISVGCDGKGTVLFTGYYTPIFDASPVRTAKYRYPLYTMPENLVKDANGNTLGLKRPDGSIVKVPSRKEIETTNVLAGKELYWLANEFEAYVAHVQGSAKLRLPDGKLITVGYAANNGRDYHSVAQEMLRDGKLIRGAVSLQAMIDYFKAHPDEVRKYTHRNPRYVFFREEPGEPRGSINEPVIPWRSIATDKSIFPPGALALVDARLPRHVSGGIRQLPYCNFALDQDTGGAIRAPGRCDVYMGIGEEAGQLAGGAFSEGHLYYLVLKPSAVIDAAPLQPTTPPTVK